MLLLAALVTASWLAGCSSRPGHPVAEQAQAWELAKARPSPQGSSERSPAPAVPPVPQETVAQAAEQGCTTTAVQGLSQQIIAESNCLMPGAYVPVPRLPNMKLAPAVLPYLASPARDALVEAASRSGAVELAIGSMLRTLPQQFLVHEWYRAGRCGIDLAAPPGRSNHESGLAIDVADPARWRWRLRQAGFRWFGRSDRWHFDYVGPEAGRHRGLDVRAFQRLWNRNNPEDKIREDGELDAATEERLRAAPARGFGRGPSCGG
ncbi:MAG: D-alanyl-D-alanine carboxypeptidase family protein [Deltaproteobacteria bacterium]|nr:D-alanyl-D-alanine carboxypeptidase family protein [Deltaproteobacteria bacterium]